MPIIHIHSVSADSEAGRKAAGILLNELTERTGKTFAMEDGGNFRLTLAPERGADEYEICCRNDTISLLASGIRGFLYAIGMFLRKTEYRAGEIFLTEEISGLYSPSMPIRGHQLGWRTTSNTYEAWTPADTCTYMKELMYFGCNVFEHTVYDDSPENRNALMKQSEKDYLRECTRKAKELGMDVSFWYPNDEKPAAESIAERAVFFQEMPAADFYFPPGGDPGNLDADAFLERTKTIARTIKKRHPNVKIYPSAQSPHGFENWGDVFLSEMKKQPPEIDGVITGPNAAMPLHELRERLPLAYPIRLYPDITHNVRCEYPVHFDRDDWHYAFAAALSRETINPRPTEYRTIHRLTRPYVIGSVSYSEGIHDDVNKMVWSDMDFFPGVSLTDTLRDYARLFFYGADSEKAVSGILGLEKNWEGDPAENPHIEATLGFFEAMASETPALLDNTRFLMLLFRAKCDRLIQLRRKTELSLIQKAKRALQAQNTAAAKAILQTPFADAYVKLRQEIFSLGKRLFEKAGLQLDTEHYLANSWERGATLDTIDNPVTDRLWLQNRIAYAETLPEEERAAYLLRLLNRNKTKKNEYYFSFSENSMTELGVRQEPYFYMDFQGDRPSINNGTIPMSMLKVFDHYSFHMQTGGLTGRRGYRLILNIKPHYNEKVRDFTIKINGQILYHGAQYGGTRDEKWEKELSAPGFECRVYPIPPSFLKNGCLKLDITEPLVGIMLSEIFIRENES